MQISLFVVLKKCSTNLVFKITNIYSTISINLQGQGKFPLLLTKRHWNRPLSQPALLPTVLLKCS